jgi:hypothetical protein
MKLKKLKDTYNDYQMEISYGQLMAIKNALATDHSEVLSDELYSEINWYLQNVPGPGESEEEFDSKNDGGLQGAPGKEEGGADDLLPAPNAPGEEAGPEPSGGGEDDLPPGRNLYPGEGGDGEGAPDHSPEGGDEADQHLPAPDEE